MSETPPGPQGSRAAGTSPGAGSTGASRSSWTILELLRWTTSHFESKGIETARLDAECLLAHALGVRRLELYVQYEKPVTPDERAAFRELVVKRASERVPVSHLLGAREFWSLSFEVTGDVLAPRPETETLVEAALAAMPDPEHRYRVLDVGTGSGAIALALAKERPGARVTATDVSPAALKVARRNAEALQLGDALRLLEGSLYEPVRGEQFDVIVSNPPYVARSAARALPPELAHEPELALFGGDDGYSVLRPLVAGSMEMLAPGGWAGLELDPGQAETVATWCDEAGLIEVETLRDLAGRPRVVAARKPDGEGQDR